MRKQQTRLAGLSHLLRPEPKRVETDAAWNGHLDRICEVMQGLKVEGDSNAPAEPEPDPQPELELEEKPKRKAKSKPNRMREGGEDRDDAA
jgi:hypothetical protein